MQKGIFKCDFFRIFTNNLFWSLHSIPAEINLHAFWGKVINCEKYLWVHLSMSISFWIRCYLAVGVNLFLKLSGLNMGLPGVEDICCLRAFIWNGQNTVTNSRQWTKKVGHVTCFKNNQMVNRSVTHCALFGRSLVFLFFHRFVSWGTWVKKLVKCLSLNSKQEWYKTV
jgi:hypothetical protein